MEKHKNVAILIQGDKQHKTRAYRMAINAFYDELLKDFSFQGVIGDITRPDFQLEEFTRTTKYEGFIIKRN